MGLLPILGVDADSYEKGNGGAISGLEEGISKGFQHYSLTPVWE